MKLVFLNIYSTDTMARYLLSSYVLKAYLTAHYQGGGLKMDVLDFRDKESAEGICEKLIEINADVIGYSCYVWNIEKILDVIKHIKDRAKGVIHVLGGPEVSLGRIPFFQTLCAADYYVIGEGERKLLHLIDYLQKKKDGLKAVLPRGIAYGEDNKLSYSEEPSSIEALDEIPSVYLTGAIEDRLYARQQAFMETQRGCRYKCKYCVYHKNLASCSYYSLERVYEELQHLIVKKRVRALRVFDAVFTTDLDRAKKIARYLLDIKNQEKTQLPWIYWEFTYDSVDDEFIRLTASLKNRDDILNADEILPEDRPQYYTALVKDYNVISCVGFQSFCDQALRAVGRPGVDRDRLDRFMNAARENNIALKVDLILGLPFETFDSYFEGLEFFLPYLKATDHILNIHRLQILPGSELENLCSSYRMRYSRKAPYIIYSTNSMSEEELNHASRLTALLFRILNSPLRRQFFEAKAASGASFCNLIGDIYDRLGAQEDFKNTGLIRNEAIDDVYWNDEIFKEIPSEWVAGCLKSHRTYGRKVGKC